MVLGADDDPPITLALCLFTFPEGLGAVLTILLGVDFEKDALELALMGVDEGGKVEAGCVLLDFVLPSKLTTSCSPFEMPRLLTVADLSLMSITFGGNPALMLAESLSAAAGNASSSCCTVTVASVSSEPVRVTTSVESGNLSFNLIFLA